MKDLGSIIYENAKAAGRECAHADNDGKLQQATDILDAVLTDGTPDEVSAFRDGFAQGKREG